MSDPVVRENLLPANATAFEDAQSQTSARILDAPVHVIRDAREGASAPASLLGHLGWERSIHHPAADQPTLRARIDASFADHLAYGAPAALEEEIKLDTGVAVRVVEYFEESDLAWPDFILEGSFAEGEAQPDMAGVMASALARKNVRDWPARLRLRAPGPAPSDFVCGSASFLSGRIFIGPETPPEPAPGFFVGSGARLIGSIRIFGQ